MKSTVRLDESICPSSSSQLVRNADEKNKKEEDENSDASFNHRAESLLQLLLFQSEASILLSTFKTWYSLRLIGFRIEEKVRS